jgi:hypothetical protein
MSDTPRTDAARCCGAKFELDNGEQVSPCHLECGHDGHHQGFVLGSRCVWPQGYESEFDLRYDRKEQRDG